MDRPGRRGHEGLVEMTTDCSFREETLEDGSDYPELASQSPLATAFHRPEWLAAVQDITGESVRLLRVLQGRETTAILPHVHARWGPIRVLLSPPSGLGMQYLGPLIPEWGDLKQDKREARLNALAEAVRNHMRERRIRFCRIRCAPGLEDARAFQWSGFEAIPQYTYRLSVGDENAVWEGMKKTVRSDIRRHDGLLTVVPAEAPDWVAFEDGLDARYSEQGLRAPLPEGYLARLREALGTDLVLLVAKEDSEFVGGAALVRMGDRIALWQGTARGPPGIPVNDILVWESIRYARAQGCFEFELMGANTRRLADFKSKFNPSLKPYLELRRFPAWASATMDIAIRLRGGNLHR